VSDIKTVLTRPRYNVFGVSGAAAMYRKKALSDVSFETKCQTEIFSNKFHTYKEDIDLAYRLQLANWGSSIIASAVGYHERGLKNQGLSSRFRQSKLLRFMSFRNHMLFLTHTAQFTWMSITGINILAYEAFKIVWIVFFETQSLKALKEVVTLRTDSKQKREQVKRMIKNPEAIIKWLS
jgi:GT2 family glycosyltransferase